MKKNTFAFAFAIIWILLVTILLCTPGSRLPRINWSDKIWLDKWAHVFLFLVLVVLWCRAYLRKATNVNIKKIFTTITLLSILYGVMMEIVQHYFIPFRSFDFGDMLADAIGAIAGYFISIRRFIRGCSINLIDT